MVRTLSAIAPVLFLGLSLTACQPSGRVDETARAQPQGEAMPASYDWHFTPHGGSGDLDFGDGDWAEGVSVFHLSCRPDTRTVAMSWDYQEEAVLTAGTATGTFQPDSSAPTNHPVFAALKASGALNVGLSAADMRLVAKDAGKVQLADFFAYCDQGIHPSYSAAAAAAEDEALAEPAATPAAPGAAAVAEAPAAEAAPAATVEAPGTQAASRN